METARHVVFRLRVPRNPRVWVLVFQATVLLIFWPGVAWADMLLLLHVDAGGKLGSSCEVKIDIETKFRKNMSEHYDLEGMPWVACRVTEWFKIGLGWRELYSRTNTEIYKLKSTESSGSTAYQKVSNHYWQVEHRPLLDLMFTEKPGGWTLDERLRIEYRQLQKKAPFFRYRGRLRVRPPWKWTVAEIQPWLAWEMYYEDNAELKASDRLNRHRIYIGLGLKATSALRFGGYYYWEELRQKGKWGSNQEIGLETGFAF